MASEMDKQPAELYLQTHDDDNDEILGVTFSFDRVYRCDTRYIRADIAEALLAVLEEHIRLDGHHVDCSCVGKDGTGHEYMPHSPSVAMCKRVRAAISKAKW